MQLQGPMARGCLSLPRRRKTTRHGFHRASLALPAKGRSTSILIRSARPASTARCFSALPSSDACFFAGEFMGGSFLVRCAPALGGNRTLRLRIHRRKSARGFSDGPAIARVSAAIAPSVAGSFVHSADSVSLVQPVPLVVCLVCHYPSPAAIFELKVPTAARSSRERRTGRSEAGISRVL